ncbi:circadian clock-controlled protein daywake-like [Temnothorax nylanderi]|uniref:circadian clock-controlled protein daywake-like n=1 Tax=Temnothorax nylanderi TaxID=102681 RepID=UPI003A83F664
MLFYVLSVLSIAVFGLSSDTGFKLPVTTCKRNSDDYSACLRRVLEKAWPQFVAGLPEFDFPPLDPLFYKYGKIMFNSNDIHAEVIISNLSGIGLSKTRFSDVRMHFLDDIFGLEIDAHVPRIFLEAAVKINGILNVFRIVNEGNLSVTADDMRGTCNLTGHVVNDTWIVEHFRIAPSIGKFKVYFDNLFEYNKELNNLVITFVNEYWPVIYREVLPFLSDVADPWLVEFTNKFFLKVSFSKIFP